MMQTYRCALFDWQMQSLSPLGFQQLYRFVLVAPAYCIFNTKRINWIVTDCSQWSKISLTFSEIQHDVYQSTTGREFRKTEKPDNLEIIFSCMVSATRILILFPNCLIRICSILRFQSTKIVLQAFGSWYRNSSKNSDSRLILLCLKIFHWRHLWHTTIFRYRLHCII